MEISEIKESLTISTVLSHYGIRVNKNKHCCCPFHDDKTPSMRVYAGTNTVFCFSGNCEHTGKKIDVIDFIMHQERTTKHQAIMQAKALLGETKTQPKSEPKQNLFTSLVQSLQRGKKAQAYLESRHINDSKLKIGYKPQESKLVEPKHMNGCIIFPLRNPQDEIVSYYGRSINKKQHFYQENRSGLYPKYPGQKTQQLILTESIIDCATLQVHLSTIDYELLALYGTNGFTPEHIEAIKKLPNLKEIILFLDGDAAGQKAIDKYSQELRVLFPALSISKVNTPEGEDINSLLDGHEADIYTHLIENRTVLFSVETQAPKTSNSLNTDNPDYLVYEDELLQITTLGGLAHYPLDKLKVTLKLKKKDSYNPLHNIRQQIDLYHDDQVEKLIRKASERLELSSRELQHTLARLTNELEQYRETQIEAKKPNKDHSETITPKRRTEAVKFLKTNNLLEKTNELIGQSGMIGEETNRLLMYLVFTSRLREQPLHIVSLGSCGTGKTYLQEKIAELIPDDHKLEITALSENALYYFEKTELKHKLVLIEDLDGASDDKVLYAIRELQSKKKISKTITIKDAKGNMKAATLQVEGPITLAGTTTKEKLYEDNANRSLLIYLDNSQKQQDAIMSYQRNLSAGKINRQVEKQIKTKLQDLQRVLSPIQVRNPYATDLIIPETVFKPLRTNAHYLNFIEVITFYKQHQRIRKTDKSTGETYIETTLEDIEEANQLLKEVLLAKSDELTQACRSFLEVLKAHLIKEDKSTFYRSTIREWMRINPHNLRYYVNQLQQYGYIKIIGGSKHKSGYEYELTNKEEYRQLNDDVTNALEAPLDQIKKKVASVANSC